MTHKRYIISILVFAIMTSGLIVGTVGSVMETTSARDGRGRSGYSQNQSSRNNSSYTGKSADTSTSGKTTPNTATSKSVTTTVTPTRAPDATAPVQPVTPQITPTRAIVQDTPPPIDTAPAITSMTAAQATTPSQSVSYESKQISDESRNRLIILGGLGIVTAGLLYAMSYYITSPTLGRRQIPVRYIVPVQEGVTS
ncbi:MAG: hypothetical protein JWM52_573 [Candidatus Saccharibacteria bacterium]|nr:hypothetical protein [Candidatus Saccharibacteria bacterium]